MRQNGIGPFQSSISTQHSAEITEMDRMAMMLFLTMVTMYGLSMSDPVEQRLRRRERKPIIPLPQGISLERFVQTCELCGMYYVGSITYDCLNDRTHATFRGCQLAIS